ncbi:uncharacterized protein LAJ45_03020 [Morchella importuna]|uniref:uncharacterized protein n=1 Tax=Morchella importuna TaxID=1174673 RepID=UPI001E8E7C8F|nr:uncharacterized protein LAJ45_03020 [Morchella importuna]KAH8152795.1 hypothetical protein LAJ45_03020 [Morchella importuna]
MGGGGSKHEDEARRQREENAKLQAEIQKLKEKQQRLNDEKRDLELKSTKAEKAEKEAELRRINEELEQTKKNQQMMEDLRKSQEEKRRLEEKIKLDNFARKIEEAARSRVEQEVWLRQEAEKNLEEGIPPIKYPTGDQIAEKRASLGYQEGFLHIAITGCSGSGKSSLINAVRGFKNPKTGLAAFTSLSNFKDAIINTLSPNLAQTGTSETTTKIQRYADPHHARRNLAWYDVPGAGTIRVRDWQYFNDQGLYIFDIIMIAVGDRITKTDIDLLFHCKRFGIPTFFVRSKADQHIRNDMAEDDEADENEVRTGYIELTRAVFNSILTDVGLPPQKIYIVSRDILRLLNDGKGSKPKVIIDEEELIRDITDTLHKWSAPAPADA